VIEKLRPERDARGFYVRFWVFLGRAERCFRYLSPHPVVKAADVLERVPVPVPDANRARREELGLDYGKIDFVVHDGAPVLLDVNRTPSTSPTLNAAIEASNATHALGLQSFLGRR
jgi:hypothetical protein